MVGAGLVGIVIGAWLTWGRAGDDGVRGGLVVGYLLAWLIYRWWLHGQRRGVGW